MCLRILQCNCEALEDDLIKICCSNQVFLTLKMLMRKRKERGRRKPHDINRPL